MIYFLSGHWKIGEIEFGDAIMHCRPGLLKTADLIANVKRHCQCCFALARHKKTATCGGG
ncbi:hypothetical protein DCCM_4389 [Desulfocucumis palustris]|uniref:Uncharacterized protein n=1 Tax=Desulfocucumis palustris TaxID=1898651 RepID=A0A2L2XLT6_9FIRM|nr:hypothetical protein DCCM_4389 [Desulfocucumis palustris]